MNLKPFFTIALCFSAIVAFAQKTSQIPFRFATRAEAQMLITDIDNYTRRWNQFDINIRLQTEQGRKSKLLAFAMDQTLNWSDNDKQRISQSIKALDTEIKKQKLNIKFPKELVFVKTTMKEECNTDAYTRENWIAVGEKALADKNDTELTALIAHEIFHLLSRCDINFKKAAYQTIGFTVMDREILFPADIIEKRISNPDINRYDSYINVTVNGEKQNCTMITYTDTPYDGKQLTDYIHIGLIPLNEHFIPIQINGQTVIYNMNQATDFVEQTGKNSNHAIDPEEILADNFSDLLTGKKELQSPEVTERLRQVLK